MYKFSLVLLLFSFFTAKSQVNPNLLYDEWIKTKTRMIDGSKDVSEAFLSSKFHRWKISKQKLQIDSNPISTYNKSDLDFEIENNYIITSPYSGYEIIKLTQDSLIVVERIKDVNENDKIRKHWFVKSAIIKNYFIDKYKNDSIIIASENFTPVINKNFIGEILKEFQNKNNFPNFNLIGNIVFYPKKNKLEIEITNPDDKEVSNNYKNIDFIKRTLEKTYPNWNLNYFKNFDKVYLPFIIKSYSNKKNNIVSKGTPIYYFISEISDIDKIHGITMENLRLSGENFEKGIKAFQTENYDKAIDYFLKSYEIDNRKIDALYNIASLFSLKQDKINECKYLKILSDLEQTQGMKSYNEKCSK